MKFEPAGLPGLWVIEMPHHGDDRGCFTRVFCRQSFADAGIPFSPVQMSSSSNRSSATLRGLHWQDAPHRETKLVQVTRGRIFDVAVDLRPASPTHLCWFGLELDDRSHRALLISPGFAHGYITLEDSTDVLYAMDESFVPALGCGARWDDPAFRIDWPALPRVISDRDRQWPAYTVPATE